MAAIDNLNKNISDLKAVVEGANIPVNQEVAIQAAADNIAAIKSELQTKLGQ